MTLRSLHPTTLASVLLGIWLATGVPQAAEKGDYAYVGTQDALMSFLGPVTRSGATATADSYIVLRLSESSPGRGKVRYLRTRLHFDCSARTWNNLGTWAMDKSGVEKAVSSGKGVPRLVSPNIPDEKLEFGIACDGRLPKQRFDSLEAVLAYAYGSEDAAARKSMFETAVFGAMFPYSAAIPPALHVSADNGDRDAMVRLGRWYELRVDMPDRVDKALGWYLKAAEAGNTDAMVELFQVYSWDLKKREGAEAQAQHWLSAAVSALKIRAQKGDIAAALRLGQICVAKVGCGERATDWFQVAAEGGSSEAMFELSNWIDVASLAPSPEALKWLKMAAEHGHLMAARRLADHYADVGDDAARWEWSDKADAIERARAESGNGTALRALACRDLWTNGKFSAEATGPDPANGIRLLTQAAEHGSWEAGRILYLIYTFGIGTAVDSERAEHWMSVSDAVGPSLAPSYRDIDGIEVQ